jgi:hypothetical protein
VPDPTVSVWESPWDRDPVRTDPAAKAADPAAKAADPAPVPDAAGRAVMAAAPRRKPDREGDGRATQGPGASTTPDASPATTPDASAPPTVSSDASDASSVSEGVLHG